ncbi:MAG TPA: hypothetical protein VML55_19305 [Planctomycetaceae bacterium]|nr:hypothetical protein [Planctomycetaceae bacterium]
MQIKRISAVALALAGSIAVGLASWFSEPQADEPRLLAAGEAPLPVAAADPGDQPPVEVWPEPHGLEAGVPFPLPVEVQGVDLSRQTPELAAAKSQSCVECHATVGDPHMSDAVQLGCTDCHGGDATAFTKEGAHVMPRLNGVWHSSANPVRSYTALNYERPEFIRFVNPGDLRVAHISCGTSNCHPSETLHVKKSMMTHGCMLWGAALYNNGAVPNKWPRYGESYSMYGKPQRLQTVPAPTPEETDRKGVLPYLDPMPRFNVTHPGNVLRIFERGGRFVIEPGIPERLEEPGKPRNRVSNRGLGTLNRTDPVFIGLQKTRLLDPTLNFLGTNDHPGDYRSSGCTACHVIYANDRSPVHSGPYAKYGHLGRAAAAPDGFVQSVDPTIPKDESGHPIEHRFTRAIPTSQCIVCHTHPGTTVMNSYLGYMWWDMETDGRHMYPAEQKDPTNEEFVRSQMSNPNDIAAHGNWSDPEFLARVAELNPILEHTQFADFHGHGWVYRAVFKKNRAGELLDHRGNVIPEPTTALRQLAVLMPQYVQQLYRGRDWDERDPDKLAEWQRKEAELERLRVNVPVHMLDIHLEKGMHCIDCHFIQDVHGNGKLYGEVRAAIEIQCTDCHGDITRRAIELVDGRLEMRTSGPAAEERPHGQPTGRDLTAMRTPFGKRRFEVRGDRIIQNSMVEKDLSWEITQVRDTIDPSRPQYNALSALSKTVRFDEQGQYAWGDVPDDPLKCAHSNQNMSCIACHSSWNPSCYGCHLPQKADKKMADLHNEGDITKNYVAYNFQTLRDDVYMLARDGNVTGNRIGPSRSSCAIHVGSYNANRESIYVQQQTISAEGLSGISFSTNVPHTVRGKGETKTCTDCHVSQAEDNNATMAQLLMHGTNYLNFIGRYCWVAAEDHGLWGVIVTERDEPQAVIGSTLQELAFPEHFHKHVDAQRQLQHAHEHPGNDIGDNVFRRGMKVEVKNIQHRGEFLYAACGDAGLRIFDIAFIDHKGFSERIVTAPVSPVGQRLFVRTKHATAVAAPTTIAPDPTRTHLPENHEASVHAMYGNIYVTDRYEGLIVVGVATLLDGNPLNNFVKRELTFNPDGILCGAEAITIVGTYAYICCDAGLVVVSLEDPTNPYVTAVLGEEHHIHHPHAVQVQFRYGFVCDEEGVKVIDTTDLARPEHVASLELPEAHNIYVARTYAYVAGGSHGLIILDVSNPREPKIDQIYDAYGCINDLHDVKLGITYVSEFAYLADGKNGMRIVQLTSPEVRGNDGFSPRPVPRLIATYKIPHGGHAHAISKGVDRDRAVDESGNQIAVFGRVGARPLSLDDQRRMYLRPEGVWKVIDGRRNFEIAEPRQREIDLHYQLERYYGESRLRDAGPAAARAGGHSAP